jgi:hypothetical protein
VACVVLRIYGLTSLLAGSSRRGWFKSVKEIQGTLLDPIGKIWPHIFHHTSTFVSRIFADIPHGNWNTLPKKMTWLQQDSGNLGEAVRVLGLQRVGRHEYCCPSANHDGVTSGAPRLNTDSTDVGHLPVFNLTSTDPQQYKLALGIKMAWSKCTCGLITG